jgi:hypothetical protein
MSIRDNVRMRYGLPPYRPRPITLPKKKPAPILEVMVKGNTRADLIAHLKEVLETLELLEASQGD